MGQVVGVFDRADGIEQLSGSMRCCTGSNSPAWCPGPTTLCPTRPSRRLLKNALPARLAEARAAHPTKRIELWFQDEARFG